MQPSCRNQKSSHRPLAWITVKLAALAILLACAACGVKAPPVAPNAKPPSLASFGHQLDNDRLTLYWTMAADGSQPQSFTLYRARTPLAEKPCDGCPLVFTPLRTFPAKNPEQGSLTLILEPGFHYGFKLTSTAENGLTGPESQTILIEY